MGFHEINKAVGVVLDQRFLQCCQIAVLDGCALELAGLQQRLDGGERSAGELSGGDAQIITVTSQDVRMARREEIEPATDLLRAGQRQADTAGTGVADDERIQVVDVLRDQEARQRMSGEQGVRGPFPDEHGQGAELIVKGPLKRRCQQVGGLDEATDLDPCLPNTAEIGAVAEIVGQRSDGRTGLAGQFGVLLELRPLGEAFTALFDAYAIANVVAQYHIEARHEYVEQEIFERAEPGLMAQGQQHTIVDVAVEYELAVGATLVEANDLIRPGRYWRCFAHGALISRARETSSTP